VREALTVILSIGYLFYMNARLAAIAITMGPVVAWLVTIINRKFRRYSRRIQDSMGDITRVAKETLDAPRVVKVYNAQGYQNAQFEAVNEHNRKSFMRLVLTKGLSNPVVQLVMALGSAVVLSIAIADVVHGRKTMGELMGFLVALVNISQPLRSLVAVAVRCSRASRRDRASSSCSTSRPSRRAARSSRSACGARSNSIACRSPIRSAKGVTLQNLSLRVAAGQVIAIVGKPAAANRRW
jgi:subfamily B ATP-binding cassette protein MsbA